MNSLRQPLFGRLYVLQACLFACILVWVSVNIWVLIITGGRYESLSHVDGLADREIRRSQRGAYSFAETHSVRPGTASEQRYDKGDFLPHVRKNEHHSELPTGSNGTSNRPSTESTTTRPRGLMIANDHGFEYTDIVKASRMKTLKSPLVLISNKMVLHQEDGKVRFPRENIYIPRTVGIVPPLDSKNEGRTQRIPGVLLTWNWNRSYRSPFSDQNGDLLVTDRGPVQLHQGSILLDDVVQRLPSIKGVGSKNNHDYQRSSRNDLSRTRSILSQASPSPDVDRFLSSPETEELTDMKQIPTPMVFLNPQGAADPQGMDGARPVEYTAPSPTDDVGYDGDAPSPHMNTVLGTTVWNIDDRLRSHLPTPLYRAVRTAQITPIPELLMADISIPPTIPMRTRLADYEINVMEDTDSPGYLGEPYILHGEDKEKSESSYQQNYFNLVVSDAIPFNRRLADFRHPSCAHIIYPEFLPDTSVIICFYNEARSTLMRTITSVLNRTPNNLLKEILLVDDFSNTEYLRLGLSKELEAFPKVRLIRLASRQGLIRARLRGAEEAVGTVLTFLDAHCECNVGWIEPLLHRIALNRSVVAVPVIDDIDYSTFQYKSVSIPLQVGVFNWEMEFEWRTMTDKEAMRRTSEVDEIRTPVMAGGLFSIEKAYFDEIGRYDDAMKIWGGENIEMSFRVWLCGGSVETLPCSRVGHVFRPKFPYTFPHEKNEDVVGLNLKRVVDVWLQDYSKYFYDVRPHLKTVPNFDVSKRLELKEKLQCKPFSWYINEVYPEIYIPDLNYTHRGEVRNDATATCFDTLGVAKDTKLAVAACHHLGGNQLFKITSDGRIQTGSHCLSYTLRSLKLTPCSQLDILDRWQYKSNVFKHTRWMLCLQVKPREQVVAIATCDNTPLQKFSFHSVRQRRP